MKIEKAFRESFGLSFAGGALLACLACPATSARPAQGTKTAGAGSATAKVDWTRFQDPFEKAFTMDVPRGWTVKGGLFRLGYSDQRPMVDLVSPDGAIELRFGDVSIPSYTLPNPYHQREGEIYDLGAQAQMVVEHYRTGPEFAVLYAQARFAKTCKNPQPDSQDSDFSLADIVPTDASATQSSGGQTAFRCGSGADARVAYAYTKTGLYGQIWQATTVVSFLAPPDQVAAVREIVTHSAKSFQLSPEWIEFQKQKDAEALQYQRVRQQGRIGELQQQMQQFAAKMQAMQNQVNAFERRQNAQAAQVEGFTNALVGLTPTTDPLTGENRLVWSGPKSNYWVNGQGQVLNSTNAPAPGYRQLQIN